MKYRKLGNTGYDVSEIGFGTWQIGGKRWNSLSPEENVKLLQDARELGVNIFDAAVVYGQYQDEKGYLHSESLDLLGKAFADNRSSVIYCIKLGQLDEYTHRSDYNPQRVVYQFKQTLKRLNTDYLDIALIHAPSIAEVKDGKAISILQTLRSLDYVKAIGYSFECEPEHVQEASKQDIEVIMLQYNLFDDQCKQAIHEASNNGIGVLAGGPFKRGYLTGKLRSVVDVAKENDDYWQWNMRYNKGKVEHILEKVNNELNEIGEPVKLREKALNFVLAEPIASAIVGHRSIDEVRENIGLVGG